MSDVQTTIKAEQRFPAYTQSMSMRLMARSCCQSVQNHILLHSNPCRGPATTGSSRSCCRLWQSIESPGVGRTPAEAQPSLHSDTQQLANPARAHIRGAFMAAGGDLTCTQRRRAGGTPRFSLVRSRAGRREWLHGGQIPGRIAAEPHIALVRLHRQPAPAHQNPH